MLNRKIRYAIYAAFVTVLVCVAYLFVRTPDVSMRIIYTSGRDADMQNVIAYDTGLGFQSTELVKGAIDVRNTYKKRYFEIYTKIPEKYRNPAGMQLLFPIDGTLAEEKMVQIKSLEFYNHNISMEKYSPEDLYQMFTFEHAKKVFVDDDRLCIEIDKVTPSMMAGEKFLKEYQQIFGINQYFYFNLIFLWCFLLCVMILVDYLLIMGYQQYQIIKKNWILNKKTITEILHIVTKVIICIAIFAIAYMAFKSQHYAHPDEDVTKLAIDYYMGKWVPPDVRSNACMGTFSYYGYTRLAENSLYYLIAGKVGWLCATFLHVSRYYRVLNVLMFTIMAGILLVKGRKHPYFIVALGITPQLWYLFSYATSDAFDYFISFLILYQFVEKDSILNKLLEKRTKRPYLNLIGCCFLFSMLLRGKENYYMILLLSFIILLFRWFKTNNSGKISLLGKYLLILVGSFLLISVRIGINYSYYDTYTTGAAGREVLELNAAETYKPSVLAETGVNNSRSGNGYTITDVLLKDGKDILTGLIWSGVGNYGWLEYPHARIYGYVIFLVCAFAYILIIKNMLQSDKRGGIRDSAILTAFILLAYFLVVYICWRGDFQTQGRYVLPLCLIVSYYSSRCKQIYQNTVFNVVVVILCLCSMYSYVFNGLYHLTML